MVKPNLEVDELTQDDASLFLTDIRVCFYYLLTSRTLIMGRSRSITTLYHLYQGVLAAFGPDRAQASQTPATRPWRFWDLTNRGFSNSARASEVRAHRVLSCRHQHQSRICQATQQSPQLDIRMSGRNSKTAPSTATKSQRRFACTPALTSHLLWARDSDSLLAWRPWRRPCCRFLLPPGVVPSAAIMPLCASGVAIVLMAISPCRS